nr:immunoglobulin light chain junction region [Macaca mulatta]MOW60761.1 immunoglobulin light chain junction region [Macaca mulatta]
DYYCSSYAGSGTFLF